MNRSLSLTSFFLYPSAEVISPCRTYSQHGVFRHIPASRSSIAVVFELSLFKGSHMGTNLRDSAVRDNIYKTPSLRRLSLEQLQGDCLQLPVNWVSLTDLNIEGNLWTSAVLSLHQGMDLLSRCPRLIRCRLEIRTAEVTPIQFALLTLPHLESLRQSMSLGHVRLTGSSCRTRH